MHPESGEPNSRRYDSQTCTSFAYEICWFSWIFWNFIVSGFYDKYHLEARKKCNPYLRWTTHIILYILHLFYYSNLKSIVHYHPLYSYCLKYPTLNVFFLFMISYNINWFFLIRLQPCGQPTCPHSSALKRRVCTRGVWRLPSICPWSAM